jgi:4-amino-4-deoxy-L-arabinose transferase-like glycosyltransferase
VSPDPRGPRDGRIAAALLVALIVLALALRVWRLGDWSFADDEIFTLRDSLSPKLDNPRPLLYFLNYLVVRPLMPLDELGLRLLPALFGVLAIPAFYFVSRRLVGTRAALFGAFLLAVNSFHVSQSQFARYWSLVFLLSAVYPFALYHGVRERNLGEIATGILIGVLAALAHPVGVLPVGGLALFLAIQLRHQDPRQLWRLKSVRWGALLAVILAAVVAVRYVPVLHGWIVDRPRVQVGDHLLHTPGGLGVKQLGLVLSYVEGLTLPVLLSGAVGIYLLWQRDRDLAQLLACLFIFPVAFIVLLSTGTAVSTTYLLPAVPVLFVGAGVFLDRLAAVDWGLRPRWLLPATVAAIIMTPSVPTLVSQYRDGRRADFRGVARWLERRLAPQDAVYSDQYRTLAYYLRGTHVDQLGADPAPLMRSVRLLQDSPPRGALWIVAPVRGGVRSNPKLGRLKRWIYENCQLRNTFGVPRLDFRKNDLQVYRCPPAVPAPPTLPLSGGR